MLQLRSIWDILGAESGERRPGAFEVLETGFAGGLARVCFGADAAPRGLTDVLARGCPAGLFAIAAGFC